jgi:molybdate transport system permease protein
MAIFSAVEDGDMFGAFLWVSLIVLLSLGIIRLMHWQIGPRRPALASAAAPISPPGAFIHEELRARSRPIEKPAVPATIEIDVEKKLKGSTMQVALHTGKGALGLLGASGAGKSMTLRMIAGIVAPDSGYILLSGRVLYDSPTGRNLPAARRRIGVVFQDYALFPNMTVAENIGFGLSALPQEERQLRIVAQLESMHIAELAGRYPRELSGGQRQRVAIARCMATEPNALLFDEPFAALDPHQRRRMEEQLRETLAGYTGAVIFVTHDMEEAFRFCADLVVLDGGKVIASGPKHQIFEHPQTVAVAQLTGCKNIAQAWRAGGNQISVGAWNCELHTAKPVPHALTHVGFRSHQFILQPAVRDENTFPCWLVGTSEAPHEMTLYLRLQAPARPDEPANLQADVSKELWRALVMQPQPWEIKLDPARLLMLEG